MPSKKAPVKQSVRTKLKNRVDTYLARRPHRSFRRTLRRDYTRSLELPGYFAFTADVRRLLWANKKTFLLLALTFAVLTAIVVGVGSQSTYSTMVSTLKSTSNNTFTGFLGEVGKASLIFVTTSTGALSQNLDSTQTVYAQIFGVLFGLMTWLTVVWLLRNILAGHKVKLRDGLYSASAPLLATFLVGVVVVLQLLPLALALIAYSAATTTGLIAAGGAPAMIFWIVAALLVLLSAYLITSTLFALVIVTLPGMYPFRAIRTAGDLVIGRRMRILLRILWMIVGVVIAWAVIMIPLILIDNWVTSAWKAFDDVPFIPFVILALSSFTIIWIASYIYLLYRRIVADDAKPA
jgi:hypothetical protein